MVAIVYMDGKNIETVRVMTPLGEIDITLIPDNDISKMRVVSTMLVKSTSGAVIEVENSNTEEAMNDNRVYPARSNFYMALTKEKKIKS